MVDHQPLKLFKLSMSKITRAKQLDQQVAETKQQEEVLRKRKLIKDKFYPLLLETSKSIEEAKQFITMVASNFRSEVTKHYLDKLSSLEMQTKLDPKGDNYDRYIKLLDIFKDESIASTITLIEELPSFIDGCVREKNTITSLKELKAEDKLL